MKNQRVVITGIGTISSLGCGIEVFNSGILSGKSGVKMINNFSTSHYNSHLAGEITDFNPKDYIKRISLRRIDNISRYAISAARLALDDAKIKITENNSHRIGVTLGTMFATWGSLGQFHEQMLKDEQKRVNPACFPNIVPNIPASQVSIEFGLMSVCNTISSGFCSSLDAIGWATRYLQNQRADIILAGGADELNKWLFARFVKLNYLSAKKNGDDEKCRPFDAKRNGLILGEGAALFALETAEHAQRRGAAIYAEIAGYGSTNDAHALFNNNPDAEASVRAMQSALASADLVADDVGCIMAEGNGMVKEDKRETNALKKVFGPQVKQIPISSLKGSIGHCLGASGAFNVVSSIKAINDGTIPVTLNHRTPDAACDLNIVKNIGTNMDVDTVMANAFSLGGENASLIIKKY